MDRIHIPGPLCCIPKVLEIGETHFLFCLLFDTVHDEAQWTKLTNFVRKLCQESSDGICVDFNSPMTQCIFSVIYALASRKWLILTNKDALL